MVGVRKVATLQERGGLNISSGKNLLLFRFL